MVTVVEVASDEIVVGDTEKTSSLYTCNSKSDVRFAVVTVNSFVTV